MNYIKVKNWDGFQCFHDGRPTKWIKFYLTLLDNEDFEELPEDCKLLLLMIWLFTARKGNGKVKADSKWLLKKLPVKKVRLQPLIDAGFIETNEVVQEGVRNRTQIRVDKSRVDKDNGLFLEFWSKYPKRYIPDSNSYVKTGKELAHQQFVKLNAAIQKICLSAVGQMKVGRAVPDAWRWLRDKKWKDFDPPKPADPKIEAERAEREHQKQREEKGKYYRLKTTEELKEDLESYGCFLDRWLIKEILKERNND